MLKANFCLRSLESALRAIELRKYQLSIATVMLCNNMKPQWHWTVTSILAHESRGWLSNYANLSWASGVRLGICGQHLGGVGTGWLGWPQLG